MQITLLGQAGLYIETRYGSVLCDPWFNPAYFASWFPFPSNEQVDLEKIARPTYLYISHLHHDHFDPQFLREHVWKEATVILPDYPLSHLERELRACGFRKFIHTKNCVPIEIDGLRLMIMAVVMPPNDPVGDSGLMVDDGEVRIFNQNDSHPDNLEHLARFGPFDALFLQYSGAIWYPMVYEFPGKMKEALGRKKRENGMIRALHYAQEINASFVVPSSGPPCFLDDELFSFNDFDRDPTNTFPDQTAFLDYMRDHGFNNGHLMIPGSVGTLAPDSFTVRHPLPDVEVQAIFTNKRDYLDAYKARQQARIDAERTSWPRGRLDILASLQAWFEPLMQQGDMLSIGINSRVLIDCGAQQVTLDFRQRRVYAGDGEPCEYTIKVDSALVEYCILHHLDDWVNELFLSCRFSARRTGPYNEYIYNFFKCLSSERLQFVEEYYAEKAPLGQLWEADGYRIQRYCPHQRADLTRFGSIENSVLTCSMHGWQFELATGRCLTTDDRRLYTRTIAGDHSTGASMNTEPESQPTTAEPVASAATEERAASALSAAATPPAVAVPANENHDIAMGAIRARCKDCSWLPPGWREAPVAGEAAHNGNVSRAAQPVAESAASEMGGGTATRALRRDQSAG